MILPKLLYRLFYELGLWKDKNGKSTGSETLLIINFRRNVRLVFGNFQKITTDALGQPLYWLIRLATKDMPGCHIELKMGSHSLRVFKLTR